MEILTYQNKFKCLECGKTIFIKDINKNEIYCRYCGLIYDTDMLEHSKKQYTKAKIKEIKERLKKENKQEYNNFINDLKAIKQKEKEKQLNKLHFNKKSKSKLDNINYLLYGTNNRKQKKQKITN